jgi:hypothetical protein
MWSRPKAPVARASDYLDRLLASEYSGSSSWLRHSRLENKVPEDKERNVAKVFVYRYEFSDVIPPDGIEYFYLGPFDQFQEGAITVTAHPYPTALHASKRYMEVIQMATRVSNEAGAAGGFFLDIVVRNNGHVGSDADSINGFSVYTSVILRDQD